MPYPDLRHYTLRDYGNRVGIYRLLKLMEHYQASPSLAISGALAERYPQLLERLATTSSEWLGHGWNMLSMHAGELDPQIEAAMDSQYPRCARGLYRPTDCWLVEPGTHSECQYARAVGEKWIPVPM